jgi:hypothetical protein
VLQSPPDHFLSQLRRTLLYRRSLRKLTLCAAVSFDLPANVVVKLQNAIVSQVLKHHFKPAPILRKHDYSVGRWRTKAVTGLHCHPTGSFEGAPVLPFGALKVLGDKRTAGIAFLMLKMGGFTVLVDATSSHPAAAFSASIVHVTA